MVDRNHLIIPRRREVSKLWFLRETYEFSFSSTEQSFTFRVEVFSGSKPKVFKIGLFRYESLRVTPSFGEYPEGGADYEILVKDPFLDGTEVSFDQIEEVRSWISEKFHSQGFR